MLTEAFAATLEADPELAQLLTHRWLERRDGSGAAPLALCLDDGFRARTQRWLPDAGKRIDLELRFGRRVRPQCLVWVEAKVDAEQSGETQLIDYARALRAEAAEHKVLVYLTRPGRTLPEEAGRRAVVHADWQEVARALILRHRLLSSADTATAKPESYRERLVADLAHYLNQEGIAVTDAFGVRHAFAISEYQHASATIRSIWSEAGRLIDEAVKGFDSRVELGMKPRPDDLNVWRTYTLTSAQIPEGARLEWNLWPRGGEFGDQVAFGAGLTLASGQALDDRQLIGRTHTHDFQRFNDGHERFFRFLPLTKLLQKDEFEDQVHLLADFVLDSFSTLVPGLHATDASNLGHTPDCC